MTISELKSLEGEMKKCFRCSLCKMVPLPTVADTRYSDCCPSNHEFLFHGYSGSGKSIMGLSLLDNRIDVDEDLAHVTFACTACGYCDVACKFIMEAERHKVNMALREYIVEMGKGLESHSRMIGELYQSENKTSDDPSANDWIVKNGIKKLPEEQADILIYNGCHDDKDSLERVIKIAKLLKEAGLDVGVLGSNEKKSGIQAYWTGHKGIFEKTALELTSQINASGVNTVVAVSGTDLGMLRSKYPEYGFLLQPEVMHVTELLETLVKEERLVLSKPVNRHVTYHDPCYLGRQSEPPVAWKGEYKISHGCMSYTDPPKPMNMGTKGVYDAPRRLLKAIPGIHFTEMFRIREYSYCCGGGGGVPYAYPDFACATAQNRLQEAVDAGAECMVTACHQCRKIFTMNALSNHSPDVTDIIDIVAESAGI